MKNIEEYIKKVIEHQEKGEYEHCASIITDAAAVCKGNKQFEEISINTVKKLYEQNRIQKAELLAIKLLNHIENEELYFLSGEIYSSEMKFEEAIKYYSAAIKVNGTKPEYYFKKGIALCENGFLNEAEDYYMTAASIEPNNETYNLALAYLYYLNNKINLAEKINESLCEKNTKNIKASALKILILLKKTDLYNAGKEIQKYANKDIEDDFYRYATAMYFNEAGLTDKALKEIKNAIKSNRNSTEYKYEYAKMLLKKQDYETCKTVCDEIINNNDKYIQAYILKSDAQIKLCQYEGAKELLKKAKSLDRNMAEIYYLSGEIDFLNKKYKEAAENFKTAISMSPGNKHYYEKTGECLFKTEDYADAYLYYKEAAELDISEPRYRYCAAKCCENTGDKANAEFNYSLMMRLSQSDFFYTSEYSKFLYSIGNKKKAIKLLKSLTNKVSPEEQNKIKNILQTYK